MEARARGGGAAWLARGWGRWVSLLLLLGLLPIVAGREAESPQLGHALVAAVLTVGLGVGWVRSTLRVGWLSLAVMLAAAWGLAVIGHFLTATVAVTAVIVAIAVVAPLPWAVGLAIAAALIADAALLIALGSVPRVHIVFIDVFWVVAFLLGRYLAFAQRAQAQAEELLRLTEEVRGERERAATLNERARVAREVHDILAHTLGALGVQLEAARGALPATRAAAETRLRVERAQSLARQGLEEMHYAVASLRGEPAPGLHLLPALVSQFEKDTGIACRLTIEGDLVRVSPEVDLACYRVAQEALTNAAKHSPTAAIAITVAPGAGDVLLTVESAAELGSPEGGAVPGNGLAGMRERADLVGGELVATPTGQGYRVSFKVPR